jgi:hypothetical protein
MFNNAQAFNQDIGGWIVSNGTQFQNMFEGTLAFNQDLDNWNMSNATNISSMFFGAQVFNGDITNWDITGCTNFSRLFRSANDFNQDLSGWDVSGVTNFSETFSSAQEFDQNLGSWDVGAMTNGNNMFSNARISLANWDSTLIGWFSQNFTNSNVTVGASNLRYCAAVLQRASMEDNSIFNFSGDIKVCSPGGVTNGTFLWYRSNAESFRNGATLALAEDGDPIDNWTDNAGDQVPAIPTGTSPIFNANFINFNSGVVFTADPLDITIPTLQEGQVDRHIAVVYQAADQDGNFFFAGNSTTANDTAASVSVGLRTGNNTVEDFGSKTITGTVTSNVPSILSFNYDYDDPNTGSNNDLATREIVLNGTSISTATLLESSGDLPIILDNDTARIGGSFNGGVNEFNGTLAELIVYPVSQTGSNRRKIESYLGIKYGITLNGADYITSNDKNIWDFSANSAYHNDIAGLFRDDLTAQDQKIGKSINDDAIVTISTSDAIADFTTINASSSRALLTEDRSGMLWGNNDGLVGFSEVTDLKTATSPISAMAREWKVQRYEYTDSVNVQFMNDLILDGERYYLLSDSDGDFSLGGIELASAIASGTSVSFVGAKLGGASGDFFTLGVVDSDGDGVSDAVDLDTDNDGIPTSVEDNGRDPFGDADGDGEPNVTDVSDGGGGGDGSSTLYTDNNGDGIADIYDTDLDGVPDYLDLDSDNDGITDLEEADGDDVLTDADGNGRLDVLTDADGDGYHDLLDDEDGNQIDQPSEVESGTPLTIPNTDGLDVVNYLDLDSDNDGIPDIVEAGGVDTDNNGRVDGAFTDTDRDGFSNVFDTDDGGALLVDENKDGDAVKNRLDVDADGDGIVDIIEAGGVDVGNDGTADTSTDTDGDGWSDTFDSDNGGSALTLPDTDGDGHSNYLDIDSDNDGIIDNVEAQTTVAFSAPLGADTDDDGWDNSYDSDAVGPAITLSNNDGAGAFDYLSLDSDGDGSPDFVEGFDDGGREEDATDDLEARAIAFETLSGNPNRYVNTDDGDLDGLADWMEDTDSDGVPNFLDPQSTLYFDVDGDGLVDLYDTDDMFAGGAPSNLPDVDSDGDPDFRDMDNGVGGLPIELVSFTAVKNMAQVQLNWVTSTEINNDYFTVERSLDGVVFEEILREKGAGNSARELVYRRIDESPEVGYNYYRLTQTDYNGNTKTFKAKVVYFDFSNGSEFTIYPNPSNGEDLSIVLTNSEKGEHTIQLLSSKTRLINEQTVFINDHEASRTINLLNGKRLAQGTYYLKIISPSGSKIEKLVVY